MPLIQQIVTTDEENTENTGNTENIKKKENMKNTENRENRENMENRDNRNGRGRRHGDSYAPVTDSHSRLCEAATRVVFGSLKGAVGRIFDTDDSR